MAGAGAGDLIVSWLTHCYFVGSESAFVRVAVRPSGGAFGPAQTLDSAPTITGASVANPTLAGSPRVLASSCGRSTPPPRRGASPPARARQADPLRGAPQRRSPASGRPGRPPRWPRRAGQCRGDLDPQGADRRRPDRRANGRATRRLVQLDAARHVLRARHRPHAGAARRVWAGSAVIAWRRGTDRIDGAARQPGAAFGASQPLSGSGTTVAFPTVAMDPDGDGVAAWQLGTAQPRRWRPAGYDGAGPRLSLSIPASGKTGQALTFGAGATDVWSSVQSIGWSFADGSTATGTPVDAHLQESRRAPGRRPSAPSDSLGNVSTASGVTRVRDTARPVLSRLRMAPRRFAVGRGRTPAPSRSACPAAPSSASASASPPGVTIRLERKARRGRRVRLPQGRRAHAPASADGIEHGSLQRAHQAQGAGSRVLPRERSRDRPAGNKSRTRRVAFTIVR